MKDKKASAPVYGLEFIIMLFIVIIVIAGLISLVNIFMGIKLNSKGVENSIFIKRIMYEPGFLIYQKNGRFYPGIIELDKFDQNRVDNIFENKNNRLAAIIELKNLETDELKTIYINEKRAVAWEGIEEIGDFDTSFIKRYVRIYDGQETVPGVMKLKVFVKR